MESMVSGEVLGNGVEDVDMDPTQRVLELMKKKEQIDEDIAAAGLILEREKNVGMDQPLVDAQDYPRADIDVPAVRAARHNIIRLQNDRKIVMKQIEEGLASVHASSREASTNSSATSVATKTERRPFAFVKSVEPDSPASVAGLRPDDELLEVGSVNHANFSSLLDIKLVIDSSEDKRVRVLLNRWEGGEKKLVLVGLVPKRWKGEGLVGCAVFPIEKK